MRSLTLSVAFLVLAMAEARSVPQNVRDLYNKVKGGRCEGSDNLGGGFYDEDGGDPQWSYCKKGVQGKTIFLHGPSTFANMDIDCDGDLSNPGDGRCGKSTDTQGETAFKDQFQKFGGIKDLNAKIHPYVVLGNDGPYHPYHAKFNPQHHNVHPLSVVAAVCGGNLEKMVYGVWGDTNGADGRLLVGEASIFLATACFGHGVNGNSGHDPLDVLYIAFTGEETVPGSSAKWKANNFQELEDSISTLGDILVKQI